MKKRKLLTDIFTVVLMVAIVLVLLAFFGVFPGDVGTPGDVAYIMLSFVSVPLALISVALIDLVFPLIDNKAMLKENSYKIKAIVKIVIFLAAVVFGVLFFTGVVSLDQFVGVGIFVVLYIAQFCINLDPKPAAVEEPEEEADQYTQYDEDDDADAE